MLLNQIYHNNIKVGEKRYLVAKRLNYWLHFESFHYLLQKNAYCVDTVMKNCLYARAKQNEMCFLLTLQSNYFILKYFTEVW